MSHVFRYFCLLFLVGLATSAARAQSTAGYGDWQLHLPTNQPVRLADAGDRIYVAAANAFYYVDKNLNTTQVLSQRDGLNDVRVTALAYDSVNQQTIVAYESANIDIIRANGTIYNINAVVRKAVQGVDTKAITQIYVCSNKGYGHNKAFLATKFGLIVLDLVKREISDTYTNIGPAGSSVEFFATTVSHDTIFAATSKGVMRGRLSNTVNLLDYRSWTPELLPGGTALIPRLLATYANHVYAGERNGLYRYQRSATTPWTVVGDSWSPEMRRLRPTAVGLLLVDDFSGVRRLQGNTITPLIPPLAQGGDVLDVVRSRDGSYYVANFTHGLYRAYPGTNKANEVFNANGPEAKEAYSILADARTNKVDVFAGEYSDRYNPGSRRGFYEYSGGQWTNITDKNLTAAQYPNIVNPVRGVRTPDGTLYVASFDQGVLEWKGPGQFRQFTLGNSPLLRGFGSSNSVRITDLAADAEGNVWIANRHLAGSASGLIKLNPSTDPPTWSTTPFAEGLQIPDRLALDDNGWLWVSVSRKTDGTQASPGMFVVDPTVGSTNSPRYFSTANGLPNNEIYDVVKDRRGDIWVATLTGVGVFNNPSGAFLADAAFRAPIVRRGDGTGFPVLYNEAIKAMAVDGGNRKWMGTNNGLWLFNEDADEVLLHFTTDNSPLPSNQIVDVEVNDKTGEVWVATTAGVAAYRGSATVTEGAPDCTKVFPNPVRPEFTGTVGISGLANNALVKITDVAGHLVYATTASGGTVTWNMTNASGERVRTGMYLVLSSDADGQNTCVSKVAVLSK